MASVRLPTYAEIEPRYTWNAPSLFNSLPAWEAGLAEAASRLAGVEAFLGRLAEGPGVLAEALASIEALMRLVGKVWIYAGMSSAVDARDPQATRMAGQAQAVYAQAVAASAFLDPELLAIGQPALAGWIASDPRLSFLAHYADNLFRKQAHVRSAEVEQLLGMLADPFNSVETIRGMLTDADFAFPRPGPALARRSNWRRGPSCGS